MSNAIDENVSFNFVPRAYRPSRPRSFGMTEIRAPYYDTYGTRHLQDVFDVIEISTGFIMLPTSGLERLVEKVVNAGLKAKPELGIQIGSGGDSTVAELAAESDKDVGNLIDRGKRALDAGASIIMIESEGITENVVEWNTGAAASIINGLGLENVMFEAADGPVFESYVKNYGNECYLFVDHNQILQLEGLRQNIWGNKSTWGRVINPRP